MSYVLGIDPSITSTGVCLLHNDREPEFHTLGTTKQKRSVDGGGEMPLALRLWHLSACLMGTLPPNSQPLLAAIETPISPLALSHGGKGYNNNIMAYAMAYEMLGKFRIPYIEVTPMQRALVATGKGNSNKEAVTEAFFTINQDMFGNPNHNEIDAYWLAMCAAEMVSLWQPEIFGTPYGGWLDLTDKTYDMLEKLEINRP